MREMLSELRIQSFSLSEMHLRGKLLSNFQKHHSRDTPPSKLFDAEDFVTHLSVRDVMVEESVFGGGSAIQLISTSGRQSLDPTAQIACVHALKPDFFTALAEEVKCDSSVVGNKRIRRAVENAQKFLKILKEQDTQSNVFANIQGGRSKEWRRTAAAYSREMRPDGYSLGGFGYGEHIPLRGALIQSVIREELSQDIAKPRLLPLGRNSNPVEMLQAIWLGVDLIECGAAFEAAERGIAYSFDPQAPQAVDWSSTEEEAKLFLSDKFLAKEAVLATLEDPEPEKWAEAASENLLDFEGSLCPLGSLSPVADYSKGYVHHLLICKEMLAQVILSIHNFHLLQRLFVEVRSHVSSSSLSRYIRWFLETQTKSAAVSPTTE